MTIVTPARAAVILVAGAVLAAGCGRGCGRRSPAAHSDKVPLPPRTLAVGAAPKVQILNQGGSVRVTAGPAGTVRVSGTGVGRGPFREEAAALARGIPVHLTTAADGTVAIEARPNRGKALGASADLEIQVPADARLSIQTRAMGVVEVRGITGGVQVECLEGDVTLRDVAGAVTVTTRKAGAVEAAGAITALTVQAAGAARITTTAGRLTEESSVRVRRGDAVVIVPAAFSGTVDLAATGGAVKDDFELPRAPSGAVVDGRLGGGGPRLSIQAKRGDAELRRR
ncbi:MAG TPA: hypothetical protein VGQ83_34690 [Polyangia bacterium]